MTPIPSYLLVLCIVIYQVLFISVTIVMLPGVYSPRPNYTPSIPVGNQRLTRDGLITGYFRQSYSNKDILSLLASVHGIIISLPTLKKILKRLGLKRRVPVTDELLENCIEAIEKELSESGNSLGYRAMWRRLKLKGIEISRDKVRIALATLDPHSVQARRRRRLQRRQYINPGPDFVWHVDGYDKLKPYGFAIHGAVDGFSRRVLWLKVGISNNNPKVVASYFLQTALELNTLPCILRCDKGTENSDLRNIQVCFRTHHDDEFAGEESFQVGRSTSNQRIEAWWAILRRQCSNYWMNLFKDMMSLGALNNSDAVHIHAIRLCFMQLIQNDLDRLSEEWNTHRIAAKASSEGPRGKPDIMYFCPDTYGTNMFGVPCPLERAEETLNALTDNLQLQGHNAEFLEVVNGLLPGWREPTNVDSALILYSDILDAIESI